jgi:hypothetical protein
MLRRTTTLLSATVVVLLAAGFLGVLAPGSAQAAEDCLARPTGKAADRSHWHYLTNRITHQRCWVAGRAGAVARGGKVAGDGQAPVQKVGLPAWFGLAGSNEAPPAAGCQAAPEGSAPQGRHWSYRRNATGQRCWQLRAGISSSRHARPTNARPARGGDVGASPPDAPARPDAPAMMLSPAAANAKAELRASDLAIPMRLGFEILPGPVAGEAVDQAFATMSFAARWGGLFDPTQDDRRAGLPGRSEIAPAVPAVFQDVTNSANTNDRLFRPERPLYLTVLVFLAALAGAFVLFGLILGAFLFLRARARRRWNFPPRGNAPGDGSPPAPLRPSESAGSLEPSSPDSPGSARRAGVRPRDADGRDQAGRDRQIVMDALLHRVGVGGRGRLRAQRDEIEYT